MYGFPGHPDERCLFLKHHTASVAVRAILASVFLKVSSIGIYDFLVFAFSGRLPCRTGDNGSGRFINGEFRNYHIQRFFNECGCDKFYVILLR